MDKEERSPNRPSRWAGCSSEDFCKGGYALCLEPPTKILLLGLERGAFKMHFFFLKLSYITEQGQP